MTPFIFAGLLLLQRYDEQLENEHRKTKPNAFRLTRLRQKKQRLAERLRRSLNRELLVTV